MTSIGLQSFGRIKVVDSIAKPLDTSNFTSLDMALGKAISNAEMKVLASCCPKPLINMAW